MPAISMPEPHLLHHFPEASTLVVLEAALAATELALAQEHPAAEELLFDSDQEPPPTLLIGHLLLTRTSELRQLLHLYTAAVLRVIGPPEHDSDDFF